MTKSEWIIIRRAMRHEKRKMNSLQEIFDVILKCHDMREVHALRDSLYETFWGCVNDRLIRRTMPMHWNCKPADRIRISGNVTGPAGELV